MAKIGILILKTACISPWYSVAGHGKGVVDDVGKFEKVGIKREIGAGSFFANSEDMVEFSNKKFGQKVNPVYYMKEIDIKQLEIAQADALLHYYSPGIRHISSNGIYTQCTNNNSS